MKRIPWISIFIIFVFFSLIIVNTPFDTYFQSQRRKKEISEVISGFEEEKRIPVINVLVLVNREHLLPEGYSSSLVTVDGHYVSKIIENDLVQMMKDAKGDGVILKINTSYRSISEQQEIWSKSIDKFLSLGYSQKGALEETRKTVMEPGYSEHHTGLAIDFSNPGQSLENERMWNWLRENAHRYGFILRYPKEKEQITNITYEPWHYRYVGKENSVIIKEKNICLEEYLPESD